MSGYVAIPTDVIRNRSLSLTARVLFGVILSYGWTEDGCTASTPTLCSGCGIGKTAFYEALQQLAAAGLVKVEAGHSSGKQRRIVPQVRGVRIPDFDEAQGPNSGFRTQDSEVDVSQRQVKEVSIETSSSEVLEPSRPQSEAAQSNVKTPSAGSCADNDRVRALFDYWRQKCGHTDAKLTQDRKRKVVARLREGYSAQDVERAIDGAARAPYVNDDGKRFDDLELICRSGSKLEGFMGRAAAAPQASVADLVSAYDRHHSRTGVS